MIGLITTYCTLPSGAPYIYMLGTSARRQAHYLTCEEGPDESSLTRTFVPTKVPWVSAYACSILGF